MRIHKKSKGFRVKIKICGITLMEQALALDAMGVDFLGFNFWSGSKRCVSPVSARKMILELKHAAPVGLFVDETPERITEIARESGIQYVQLHGGEGQDIIDRITLPVIKAIPGDTLSQQAPAYTAVAFYLFDTKTDNAFGATGQPFDWSPLAGYRGAVPYFLAGGIGPENLEEALAHLRPFGVDLNSRVETAPGIKDLDKVRECLEILGK